MNENDLQIRTYCRRPATSQGQVEQQEAEMNEMWMYDISDGMKEWNACWETETQMSRKEEEAGEMPPSFLFLTHS